MSPRTAANPSLERMPAKSAGTAQLSFVRLRRIQMSFPVEEEFIVRTERKLRVAFPVSFRNKMRSQNGGSVEADSDPCELYPFFDTSNKNRVSRSCNDIVRETDGAKEWDLFPPEAIAIGSNGSGDQLVFLRKEDDPSKLGDAVYRCEYQNGQLHRLAGDFSEMT